MIKPRFAQFWSAVTLFFFLGHTAAWSLPVEPISFSPKTELPKAFTQINIPENLAQVDEIYEAPAKVDPKLVFHIQNMHGNYEAQLQVRKLLQYLYEHYGFKTIFVEGAAEKLDPKYLRVFPDQERNFELADSLAKKGQLTGPEFFLADGPGDVEAIGIEDIDLYHGNFMAFRNVHKNKPTAEKFLHLFDNQLEKISSHILSPDTRRVLAEWRKFEKGHRDFLPFVRQLAQDAKMFTGLDLDSLFSQVEWPQVSRLLVIQAMEKELNSEIAKKEKIQVLEHLKKLRVSPEILSAIETLEGSRVTMARKGGADNQLENLPRYLFERLVDEASPKGFKFHEYPAFSLWAGYTILKSELDARSLFEEIARVFEKILNELAATDPQKNLLELHRDRQALQKLFDLELSRKEWNQALYRKDWIVPETIASRLAKLSEEASQKAAAPNHLKWEIDLKNDVELNLKTLQKTFETAFEFYRLARQREDAFYQTIETEMSSRKVEKAVLVTGGFHTDGIAEKFREHEINYSVLMPRIRSEDLSQKNYQAVMLETEPARFDLATLEQPNRQSPATVARMATTSYARSEIRRLLAAFIDVQTNPKRKRPVKETIALWNQTPYAKSGYAVLGLTDNRFTLKSTRPRSEVRAGLTDTALSVAIDLHRALPLDLKYKNLDPNIFSEWATKSPFDTSPNLTKDNPFENEYHRVAFTVSSIVRDERKYHSRTAKVFMDWIKKGGNAKSFLQELIQLSTARKNSNPQYLVKVKEALGDLTSFRKGLAGVEKLKLEERNARIYSRILESIKEVFPTATLSQIDSALLLLMGATPETLSTLGLTPSNLYLTDTLSVLVKEIPDSLRKPFAAYLSRRRLAVQTFISDKRIDPQIADVIKVYYAGFKNESSRLNQTRPSAVTVVNDLLGFIVDPEKLDKGKYALYEIYDTIPVEVLPITQITTIDRRYRMLASDFVRQVARELAPKNISLPELSIDDIKAVLDDTGLSALDLGGYENRFLGMLKRFYPIEVKRYKEQVERPFQDAMASAASEPKDANRAAKLYLAIIAYLFARQPTLSFDELNKQLTGSTEDPALVSEFQKLEDKADVSRILLLAERNRIYANYWALQLSLTEAEMNRLNTSITVIKRLDLSGEIPEAVIKAETLISEISKIESSEHRRVALGLLLKELPASVLTPQAYRILVAQSKIPADKLVDSKYNFKNSGMHSLGQIALYLSEDARFALGFGLWSRVENDTKMAFFMRLPQEVQVRILDHQKKMRAAKVPQEIAALAAKNVPLNPAEQALADSMRKLNSESKQKTHPAYEDFQIKVYYELMNYFVALAKETPALNDLNLQQIHQVLDRLDKALLWGNDKIVYIPIVDKDGKTHLRVPVGNLIEKKQVFFKEFHMNSFDPFKAIRPIIHNSIRYFDALTSASNSAEPSPIFKALFDKSVMAVESMSYAGKREIGTVAVNWLNKPYSSLDSVLPVNGESERMDDEDLAVRFFKASKSSQLVKEASPDRLLSVLKLFINRVHAKNLDLINPLQQQFDGSTEPISLPLSSIISRLKLSPNALPTQKIGGYYLGVLLYESLNADEQEMVQGYLTRGEIAQLSATLSAWKSEQARKQSWFSWSWLFGTSEPWWDQLFIKSRMTKFVPEKLQVAFQKEFLKTNQKLTDEQILTIESLRREIIRAGNNSSFILFPAQAQDPLEVYKTPSTVFGDAPEILQLPEPALYFHVYPRDIFGDRGAEHIPSNQVLTLVPSAGHKQKLLEKSSPEIANRVYTYAEFLSLLPTFRRSEVRRAEAQRPFYPQRRLLDWKKIPERFAAVGYDSPDLARVESANDTGMLKVALPWGVADQGSGADAILPYAKFITASPYDSQLQNVRVEYPGVESDAPGALVFYTGEVPGEKDLKAYRSILLSRKNQYLRVALPRGVFTDKGAQFQYEMMVQNIFTAFGEEIGKRFEVVYDVAPKAGLQKLVNRLFREINNDGISIKPENIALWRESSVAKKSGYEGEVLWNKAKLIQSELLSNASDSKLYGSFTVVGVLEGLMLAETPIDSGKLPGEALSQKDYQALQSYDNGYRFVISDFLRGYAARLQQALAIDLAISSAA